MEILNEGNQLIVAGNVSKVSQFVCQLCNNLSSSARTILDHIRHHNADNPWNCYCATSSDVDFPKPGTIPHSPSCLQNIEEGVASYERRSNDEDCVGQRSVTGSTHRCTLCSFSSPCLITVVEHIKTHLRKKDNPENRIEFFHIQNIKNSKREPFENVYNCTECQFSCLHLSKLEKHMSTHSPNVSFKCRFCDYISNCKKSWLSHHKSHDLEKPHKCPTCGKKFSRLDNMKTHKGLHEASRPYSCQLCSYAARNKSRLSIHMNLHKGGREGSSGPRDNQVGASCPICEGMFYNYVYMKAHIKLHTTVPPYECRRCHLTFTILEEFNSHLLSHIDEAALSCSRCSFKCFDSKQLGKHSQTTHGEVKPYLCELCGYRFGQAVHWRRHRLVHTGEKPYRCDVCGAKFSQSNNRKAHMIKIHSLYLPSNADASLKALSSAVRPFFLIYECHSPCEEEKMKS